MEIVCGYLPAEGRRHNYLTLGGICQECAWDEIDAAKH